MCIRVSGSKRRVCVCVDGHHSKEGGGKKKNKIK